MQSSINPSLPSKHTTECSHTTVTNTLSVVNVTEVDCTPTHVTDTSDMVNTKKGVVTNSNMSQAEQVMNASANLEINTTRYHPSHPHGPIKNLSNYQLLHWLPSNASGVNAMMLMRKLKNKTDKIWYCKEMYRDDEEVIEGQYDPRDKTHAIENNVIFKK